LPLLRATVVAPVNAPNKLNVLVSIRKVNAPRVVLPFGLNDVLPIPPRKFKTNPVGFVEPRTKAPYIESVVLASAPVYAEKSALRKIPVNAVPPIVTIDAPDVTVRFGGPFNIVVPTVVVPILIVRATDAATLNPPVPVAEKPVVSVMLIQTPAVVVTRTILPVLKLSVLVAVPVLVHVPQVIVKPFRFSVLATDQVIAEVTSLVVRLAVNV